MPRVELQFNEGPDLHPQCDFRTEPAPELLFFNCWGASRSAVVMDAIGSVSLPQLRSVVRTGGTGHARRLTALI